MQKHAWTKFFRMAVWGAVFLLTEAHGGVGFTFTTLAGADFLSGSADGTGSVARFSQPGSVALDRFGNLYVADAGNRILRKISPVGVTTTLAGTAGNAGAADGAGGAASFSRLTDVAVDSNGNVFVSELTFQTIRKVTPAGGVTTFAGSARVQGTEDGIGSAARFALPAGISVDNSGNVYVADVGSHTIRKITPDQVVTTLAGNALVPGSADGVGLAATFHSPNDVAVDSAGNVYVADGGNFTIRKITNDGTVTTFAGSPGLQGVVDGIGAAARFSSPGALTFDPAGTLFLLDGSKIRKITPAGAVSTLAGPADSALSFGSPAGLAVDGAGFFYVSDSNKHTISWGTVNTQSQTSATAVSATHGQSFTYNAIFAGQTAGTYEAIGLPSGLIIGLNSGIISGIPTVVPGNYLVSLATVNGAGAGSGSLTITVAAGQPSAPTISSVTPGHKQIDVNFSDPADTGGVPLVSYTATATPVSGAPVSVTSASSGRITVTGLINGTTYSVTIVATNSAGLTSAPSAPFSVVLPPTPPPTIIAQPVNQTVTSGYPISFSVSLFSPEPVTMRWFKDGQPITGATAFSYPIAAAAANDAGNYRVAVTNEAGTVTSNTVTLTVNTPYTFSTLAGVPFSQGFADGQGNLARFNTISGNTVDFADRAGVATDTAGNIYVADAGNHVIRKITPAGLVTTLAGSPGIAGSIDGLGSAARFNQPSGVAVDSGGNLFVADTGNHVIRMISAGGNVTTLAGAAGLAGSADGNSALARLNSPRGVAVDATSSVYVADSGNFTIRKISPGGAVTTLAGLAGNIGRNDGTGATARFNAPIGIAVDPTGNVFVADFGADAIRKVTPLGVVTTLTNSLQGVTSPTALAIDSSGNIYISSANGFLSMLASNGVLTTIAGRGNFPGAVDGTGIAVRFSRPSGVAADGAGNLYVADVSAIRKGVLGIPPQFTVQPASLTGRQGGLATFTGSASGPPTPALQWQASTDLGNTWVNLSDGAPFAGTATGTLSITPLSVAFSGFRYRCIASNIAGTTTSIAATLTVLAVPANDSFANATSLSGLSATATGDNFNAVKQSGEPDHAGKVGGHSVWWKWVAPGNGTASVDTFGSDFNTLLAVYTGNSVNALTPVAANDDSGGGVTSAVSFSAVSGTSYWIAVDGFAGAIGNISLHISQTLDFALTVSTQPFDQTTTIGYNASFTMATSGSPAPTLQWQESRDGGVNWSDLANTAPYSGATSSTLALTSVTTDIAGYQYRCVATNSSGTVTTGAATLHLNPGYTFTTLAGFSSAGSADGTGPAAQFYFPRGVAVDGTGNTYVADANNHTIRKITASGVVTTFAGSAGIPGSADGTGSAARFNSPNGVAVDGAGNVYVADSGNHTIRKITPDGAVTTLAGSPGIFGTVDGTGSAARFFGPKSVAVDSAGNVYVADFSSIRKITPESVVTIYAGSSSTVGSADGTGTAARFNKPRGVAVDNAGNIYVADTNNRTIRKIAADRAVTTLAGTAQVKGSADGTGGGAQFSLPVSLSVDSGGNVYVADSTSNTIRKITSDGVATTLAGIAGQRGSSDGVGSAARFSAPSGVAVDGTGNIFVADAGNYTIRKISSTGAVTTLAGTAGGFGAVDGTGRAASFSFPASMAVDSTGTTYVADSSNHTVRKITAGGVVTTLAGSPGVFGSADGTGSAALFNKPAGVALDGTGNVFVADTANNTIRKVTAAGVVTTLAGAAFVQGSVDGVGDAARFNAPVGIAVERSGSLLVADFGNSTIRRVAPDGTVTTLAGNPSSFSGPVDGIGSAARFSAPGGVALDSAGNLLVADVGGCAIRQVTPDGVVTTLAGTYGVQGSADGSGTAAQFSSPYGIAVDAAGNIFIADSGNNTVRLLTPDGVVTTIAGSVFGTGATDGTGSVARFFLPEGIAADRVGNVYVADSFNNTVRWGALAAPVVASATTASGAVGQSFSYATAFSGALTGFSASGLPTGLAINNATGVISGAPTVAGNFPGRLSAVNGAGVGTATLTLNVSAADQTISFVGPASQPFTATPIALIATASSGLPVSFTVVTGPAFVSGSNLILTGAGAVTVRALQFGDSVFNAALPVDQSFNVSANFLLWQLGKFTSAELLDPAKSGPNAIFGFDGLSNLVKYALGLEPKQDAVLGLPALSNNGTDWVYTYTRPTATTDVDYAVEVSTDLVNWTTAGVTLEQVSSATGIETWRGRVSISGKPKLFARLRVTQILPP